MAAELMNKQIMWYKSKIQAFAGRMIVTEERFSFSRAPKWTLALGAIGALMAGSAKGKTLVDDEIKNLKFSKGRSMGKKNYMLVVTDTAGNSYDFLFDDKLFEPLSSVIKMEETAEAEA